MGNFFNEYTGTHDVAITPGNSAAGGSTAFTAITAGVYFSTAHPVVGSSGVRIDGTIAAGVTLRYALASVRKLSFRQFYYLTAADLDIAAFAHATDTTAFTLRLTSTGFLRLVSKGGVTVWTGSVTFPLNQAVRVEFYAQQGTASNDGSIQLAFYSGVSTTPLESGTFTGLGLGGDLGALTQMRLGKASTPANSTFWMDSLAWRTDADATGLIGPPVNAAPTVSAGANQTVAAASTVNLAATASDSDGSIASYSWSFLYPSSGAPTITGATTATPSFTAGAGGNLYILRCEVTDNGGATGSSNVEVRVPSTANFSTLPIDGTGDAWTRVGGASTDGAALSDNLDTTYTESPDYLPIAQTEEYRLEPIAARDSLQFVVRVSATATGGTPTVSLIDGTTVRQTWSLTPTTSAADVTLSVTTPGNIVDWGNLRLRFSVVS